MVDEKAIPYLSPGMNFDSGKKTAYVRNQARKKRDTPVPESMSQAVELPGMKAWVGEKDLPGISGCRVMPKDRLYIAPDIPDAPHNSYPSSTRATA
jgi:hypothetical protein